MDKTFDELYQTLQRRFTSGNEVEVPDARLTRKEWDLIKEYVADLEFDKQDLLYEIRNLS